MSSSKEVFIHNLRRCLKQRNITQAELAKRTYVSTATVSDWVNGNKSPSFDNIDRITAALNVSTADLFTNRLSEVHPDDKAIENNFLLFARNKQDAHWIMKHMLYLSDKELQAYRTMLRQIELIKESEVNEKEV